MQGGVIAYPTEAVFGLGCNPFHSAAVARILNLKRRRPDKGLIIVGSSFVQLHPLLDPSMEIPLDDILATWPGPVTWVFPANPDIPAWLCGSSGGIAIRVSAHPIVHELCETAGFLVSTSANPEGHQPARDPLRVRAYFQDKLDYILAGQTGGQGSPTEIRDARSGDVIRTS